MVLALPIADQQKAVAEDDLLLESNLSFPEGFDVDFWNLNMPTISPAEFYALLTKNLPFGTAVKLYSDGKNTMSVEIGSGACQSPLNDSRCIDFERQFITEGDLRLHEELQGQGIGTSLVRNYIKLGSEVGLKIFNVHAANENGAYSWARLGVYLDKNIIFPDPIRQLSNSILSRLKNLEGKIPPCSLSRANMFARFSNPEDICAIADLDFDLFSLSDMWGRTHGDAHAFPLKSLFQNHAEGEEALEKSKIQKAALYCKKKEIPFTLGRYLLAGAAWRGKIVFSDQKQMERIQKYLDRPSAKTRTFSNKLTYV